MRPTQPIRLLAAVLAAALTLAGCGAAPSAASSVSAASASAPASAASDAAFSTGDASLDDPRNQDGIGESELLVVSFGTSYNDSRRLAIGGVESALAAACPDWSVRRAFTSQIILDKVAARDGVTMDNVEQALERAADNGVKTLVVQPTHLMDGLEYGDLVEAVANYADAFDRVAVGAPLLSGDADFAAVAKAVAEATADRDDGKTAIVLMGHGTTAASNSVYARLQETFAEAGYAHYYVGTVEGTPTLDDVLARVQAGGYEKVVLRPLMVVAGDHAVNDMAGDEPDSWKSAFTAAGYQVECQLTGLGELEAVQQLYADHARAAMESLPA